MIWNWQRKSWPHFTYDTTKLAEAETLFLRQSGIFQGTLKHIKSDERDTLIVDLISAEALKTSEIEGEILNRDSVQSSIRKHFGLQEGGKKSPPAEQGIADMMVNLYKTHSTPLTHETLFSWHKMLMKGRRDLKMIGSYRTHKEPMQVVSGAMHDPEIHFEAPPSKHMKKEMDGFIHWFNDSSSEGKKTLPALTRASIAHLYFVSIHPFEDGNGRIGRAIAEKALSQNLGQPTLIALSQTIQSKRRDYYSSLERNNKDTEITDWALYFSKTILTAQERTQMLVDFLIEKTKLYERLRGQLNERQEKVLERLFREGPEGFKGGLSAENYIKITKTSRATATRDLQELVELGALSRTGELRHTRYYLKIKN